MKQGTELIGEKVELWQIGRFGAFKKIGEIIDYKQSKNKLKKNSYLIKFKGTKNQSEFFFMWCPFNTFKLIINE